MSRLCIFLCCLFLAIMPILAAQPCEPNHELCSPEGAASYESPVNWSSNGALLADFYEDLVSSVNHRPSKRYQPAENLESRASSVNLCCTANTQCLLLQKFHVPFCWDHFTTNYFLPDDSYGNVASAEYTLVSGEMNLITGNYTKLPGQTTGNIYGIGEAPTTSTLPIPTPWTSIGVGTAIPASEVGETSNITTASPSMATGTITLGPSRISASTTSIFDATSHTNTPTIASVAGSTLAWSRGLLLVALLMALL